MSDAEDDDSPYEPLCTTIILKRRRRHRMYDTKGLPARHGRTTAVINPSPPPPPPRYQPAWWLPSPHLHTIWARFGRHPRVVATRQEQWATPDGDVLEVDRLDAPSAQAPELIILHGLEATRKSPYLQAMVGEAARRGWGASLLLFRSCGSQPNRTRRFYHAGETSDLDLVVRRVARDRPRAPLLLAGYSLGGNVLLKWLGEHGGRTTPDIRGAAAVSVPFDLALGARHIAQGFARVYQAHFLRSLKRKARDRLVRFPDLADAKKIAGARTLYAFDDVVTGPVHGFAGADDYYERSSSLRFLSAIRVPTLLLSARDDPFLPAPVLDQVRAIADKTPALTCEFLPKGGHVGFVSGQPWRAGYYADERVGNFLTEALKKAESPPRRVESRVRPAQAGPTDSDIFRADD